MRNKALNHIFGKILVGALFLFVIMGGAFAGIFTNTEGYLGYCGDGVTGGAWTNYPNTTSSTFTCLNKRYCSDIKRQKIKVGDFDRYEGDGDGTANEIIYTTKTETVNGECDDTLFPSGYNIDPNNSLRATKNITDLSGAVVVATSTKEDASTTAGSPPVRVPKCKLTTVEPKISTTLKDALLYTTNSSTCYKKSCADLTTEELEALYRNQYVSSGGVVKYTSLNDIGELCVPYKYNGTLNMSSAGNIKYLVTDSNGAKRVDDIVYCHEFSDANVLQFLFVEGGIFEKVFQCRLHQCPVSDGSSLTCDTNYYLFLDTDSSGARLRSDAYIKTYEEKVLNNSQRGTVCTPIECSKTRYTVNTPCGSIPPDPDNIGCDNCDKYLGVDNDLSKPANFSANKYNSLVNTYSLAGIQTPTSETYENVVVQKCYKTVDCGIGANSNNTALSCQTSTEEEEMDDKDITLSYFYRPIPDRRTVETVRVTRSVLESNNVGSVVYEGNFVNPESGDIEINVIKRLLVGKADYPFPYEDEDSSDKYGERANHLHDYFTDMSTLSDKAANRESMCAPSENDFKNYGFYEHKTMVLGLFPKWNNFGEYYQGFWKLTKPGSAPHILPLCNRGNKGAKGSGREYNCGNDGYICNAPEWDSYYYRGIPTYQWKTNDADIASVSATLCLRQKNTGSLSVCGERQCRVDCALSLCKSQWCGIDRCVKLSITDGQECSLETVASREDLSCAKVVSKSVLKNSKMRFRINRIGKKLYAYLDATSSGCVSLSAGDIRHSGRDREKEQNRDSHGTFKGRLDHLALLDDNSRTDNDGDGAITDNDVLGEYLFKVWRCGEDELPLDLEGVDLTKYKDPRCNTMLTHSYKGISSDASRDWITWGVVKYIGNNQPSGGANCKVDQIKNCRGFYDKDGNFFDEQQGFTFPLATSPDLFYKYATIDNAPDLFLPLLVILQFWTYNGEEINYSVDIDNSIILLDFFEPQIKIGYGALAERIISIPFSKTEITSQPNNPMETKFNGRDIKTHYTFTKTAQNGQQPLAQVCLRQVLEGDATQLIACLRRKNPRITNFFIRPGDTRRTDPYMFAYFHNKNLDNVGFGDKITIPEKDAGGNDLFLPFYSRSLFTPTEIAEGTIQSYRALRKNLFAYAQNYPILLEPTFCSSLHYDCITNKKKLLDEKEKSGTVRDVSLIENLEIIVSNCETAVESICEAMNGNKKMVQMNVGGTGYIVKVRDDYNTDGGYNQMCVTRGFEDYGEYVYAYPSTNTVLGKCNLIDESKMKKECRRAEYYKFCTERGVGGCECLDGTNTCDCSDGGSCIITNYCDCNENDDSCKNLPKECYLPGTNYSKSVLNAEDKMERICICEALVPGQTAVSKPGLEIRKATPKELGLCADLRDINFCEAVKYYDANRVFHNGGEGRLLSIIRSGHISNIWRTGQKLFGRFYLGDLGHAEFDKTNDCSEMSSAEKSEFCLLREKCYNENTGQVCEKGSSSSCKCDLLQPGQCVGFWKYKNNTVPLAKCTTTYVYNEFTKSNEPYTMFNLVPNTECERYTCPAVTVDNIVLNSEMTTSDIGETTLANANIRGLFHGFALWNSYKKGSDLTKGDINAGGARENGFGDDIEERGALNCIQGYGPAGLNYALEKYMPYVSSYTTQATILNRQDILIQAMIGYSNPTSGSAEYTSFIDYVTKMDGYNARQHLPVRYCNQVGVWMEVSDLYARYKFDPYYKTNEPVHDKDSNGFVNISKYNTKVPLKEKNNYALAVENGELTEYAKKYCERLYCGAFEIGDIGLLSVEAKQPAASSQLSYANGGADNKYYPNLASELNYPRDPTNTLDTRINVVTNNKNTPWRHAGGALWVETPAPRDRASTAIAGVCEETKNFYPYNTVFIESFQEQFDSAFQQAGTGVTTIDIKKYSLKTTASPKTQPTRVCSKWGVWSDIENKCVATCEPLDVFRTNFADRNNDGLLQNHEITQLYRAPKLRSGYIGDIVGSIKYGDKYTGGAKWARTKAGTVAIGDCDATVGKNTAGFSTNIQFLKGGTSGQKDVPVVGYDGTTTTTRTVNTEGRPYRVCQVDGTWGPVQEPCINFSTCADHLVKNNEILKITANINGTPKDVTTLEGGNISYSDAVSGSTVKYEIEIKANCNKGGLTDTFASGQVTKSCDIRTGNWVESSFASTCQLKTCGALNVKIGQNVIANFNNGEYYTKSSGYKNAFILNGTSYKGYEYSNSCPSGYDCIGCTNSKYTYTCDLDATTGNPVWKSEGECVPKTCTYTTLASTYCNSSTNCIPSDTIKTTINGTAIAYNNVVFDTGSRHKNIDGVDTYTAGTHLAVTCGSGYLEASDRYAICNENGSWTVTGGTCNKACLKSALGSDGNLLGNSGSYFYPDSTNPTTEGTVVSKGGDVYFANGASVDAWCSGGVPIEETTAGAGPAWGHFYYCNAGTWVKRGNCRAASGCGSYSPGILWKGCSGGNQSGLGKISFCTIPATSHGQTARGCYGFTVTGGGIFYTDDDMRLYCSGTCNDGEWKDVNTSYTCNDKNNYPSGFGGICPITGPKVGW